MDKKVKIMVIVPLAIALLALLIAFANASSSCARLDRSLKRLAETPIDEETLYYITIYDSRIEDEGLWGKILLKNVGLLDEVRQKNEQLIEEQAAALSAQIGNLKPCTSIESTDQYYSIRREIADIHDLDSHIWKRDKSNAFWQKVKDKVTNYEAFEQYEADFNELVEHYKVKCTYCGGSGGFTCGSCNGRGKKAVTWYSEGDWGTSSYSSYKCTSCGGSGRVKCPQCKNGYNLVFG